MAPVKKKKKKKKVKLSPSQLIDRRFKRDVDDVFQKAGFTAVLTDGKQLKVGNRKGEIDHVFLYENVLVVFERTTIGDVWSHLQKKLLFFSEIAKDHAAFVKVLRAGFSEIDAYVSSHSYAEDQYQVRVLYASVHPLEEEYTPLVGDVFLAENRHIKYFAALSRAIHHSARFELFKFMKVAKEDVGKDLLAGSTPSMEMFRGSLLPENYSSFPPGYKLVSFYADPGRLLQLGYVLRRDGWEAGVYQRMVIPKKLKSMRNYLHKKKRVYINNIIVTLPATTSLNKPAAPNLNLDSDELGKPQYVTIAVPNQYNTVGIVDGQHRILSYYESNDTLEQEIKKFREKQNLLVTGIVYPAGVVGQTQIKFEAGLFLEINSNQTTAKAELKQAIELLVDPFTEMAIARAVADGLSTQAPLLGLLQGGPFDDGGKLKISSIVSYGLKPLLKLDGTDSLFSVWPNQDKEELGKAEDHGLLKAYLTFASKEIRTFLSAARSALGAKKWQPKDKVNTPEGILTTTFLNGLFVCLRRVIENDEDRTFSSLSAKLVGINKVDLSKFKRSSLWAQLGDAIYKECF